MSSKVPENGKPLPNSIGNEEELETLLRAQRQSRLRVEGAIEASGLILREWDTARDESVYCGAMESILGIFPHELTGRFEKWISTPTDFNRLFPATGGALYGQASHGWKASFNRPGTRTKLPGLYLAGGSVHPGAGVPMAALSGRLAAECVLSDLTSTSR